MALVINRNSLYNTSYLRYIHVFIFTEMVKDGLFWIEHFKTISFFDILQFTMAYNSRSRRSGLPEHLHSHAYIHTRKHNIHIIKMK